MGSPILVLFYFRKCLELERSQVGLPLVGLGGEKRNPLGERALCQTFLKTRKKTLLRKKNIKNKMMADETVCLFVFAALVVDNGSGN